MPKPASNVKSTATAFGLLLDAAEKHWAEATATMGRTAKDKTLAFC
jgi:hypothetical protein